MALTNDQKTNRVIEWLTTHHLWSVGGYPLDYQTYRGRIFIADLDEGKERNATLVCSYRLGDLRRWYDDAVAYLDGEWPPWPDYCGMDFGDWDCAFYETKPNDKP